MILGKEKILTPVRSSRRIQAMQQKRCFGAGTNRKTLNFSNTFYPILPLNSGKIVDLDKFEETDDCIYVDNPSLLFLLGSEKKFNPTKLE